MSDDAGEVATDADASKDADASTDADGSTDDESEPESIEALRERIESEYDFEDFGPADMARMSADEWDAAFDPETWIVGEELLDRVEDDLKRRVAERDVFAVVERVDADDGPRIVAYSDEGYAIVYPDGSVEGSGTVLRDVKPTVALCSMDSYEVAPPPEEVDLPRPEEVVEGSGEFGNLMLQIVAAIQILAGLGLFVAYGFLGVSTIVAPTMGLVFLLAGFFLFLTVANARLSDRFRAEEFRNRLRAAGVESGERPAFLPDPTEARDASDSPALDAETAEERDDETA
jgi:hypothetical protein